MAFDQKEYVGKFNKDTYKMYSFRVRKDSEDIIDKLNSVPSVNKYLVSLIEKDLNSDVLSIKRIKEIIIPILTECEVKEIYLFGAYVRGDADNDSNVEIYCDQGNLTNFSEIFKLEGKLIKALGKEIELIFIGSDIDEDYLKDINDEKIRLL